MAHPAVANAIAELPGTASDLVLNGILAISAEAIITAGADLRISTFSTGAERIFGYRCEEVAGQPLEILMPERFRGAHSSHVDRFARGSDISKLMRERQEIFGLRKCGEEFPIEASISRVATAEGIIFTAIIRDVSERRRAEEHLARSEQRLRMAMHNSDLHVFEIDFQARTLVVTGDDPTFFSERFVRRARPGPFLGL